MQTLDEHFFRHEYTKLVAKLSRKVGIQHLELVEDAVQSALLKSIEQWGTSSIPDSPHAWLYRVAYNTLIDDFRKARPLEPLPPIDILESSSNDENARTEFESSNDLLHMLFICCDQGIPEPSQLVLALKILCGFSVKEIALRLFISEANVHKRYQRARAILSAKADDLNHLDIEKSASRLDSVLCVLYLVFTKGYLAYAADIAIRRDLCEEAIRLTELLSKTRAGQPSSTNALLALMYLNTARLSGRQGSNGELLLLEEQSRDQWNKPMIYTGLHYLVTSADGEQLSRYHLEAAIAAEHCRAPSFAETNWQQICQYYEQLESLFPSFQYRLNRAVALAEWQTPQAGLTLLEETEPPTWFAQSYLWLTVKADLHLRNKNDKEAQRYSLLALECAPTHHIKALIHKRLHS